MKINIVTLIVAFGIAALAAFGFFMGNSGETYRVLITVGSGLTLFATLGGLFALSSPHGGTVNLKVVSLIFLIVFIIEHLIFSFTSVRLTPYVIITGVLVLLYVLVSYAVFKALS